MRGIKGLTLFFAFTLVVSGPLVPVAGGQQARTIPPEEQAIDPPTFFAGLTNALFYTPGRLLTCVGSGVLWVVGMGITFGAVYDEAARMVATACQERIGVTDKDMIEAVKEPSERRP